MTVWMIWVQGDDHTWLEAAWDEDSRSANNDGWIADLDRVRKLCAEERYEYRVQQVNVRHVFKLFQTALETV